MGVGTSPGMALQLYTVRHDFALNPADTLREVAGAGYTAVEVAGTGDMPAGELRVLLDRFGLRAVSVHESLGALEHDLTSRLDAAGTLGVEYVTTAYLPPDERREPERLGARLDEIGRHVRDAGFTFAHHNHDFEFARVDGEPFLDRLLAATNRENVKLELDVYWAVVAGVDPLEYLRRHAGRVPLVHLKDMAQDRSFANVGEGTLDFPRIAEVAVAQGVRWFIVEHDDPGPRPVEAARISLDNLKQMGIAR